MRDRALFYRGHSDFVEITIRGSGGVKLGKFTIRIGDTKEETRILKLLMDKYGFSPNLELIKKGSGSMLETEPDFLEF